MSYIFPPAPPTSVPVQGRPELFAVHRVYCVGRNYAEHTREMGGDPQREPPIFFSKPADAVVPQPVAIDYPPRCADLHHEVELVIALGSDAAAISPSDAPGLIFGFAVGVDLTRRDLQNQARKAGAPWDTAKGFDQSAPVSALRPVADTGLLRSAPIWLKVNGLLRQQADIAAMIWNAGEILAELSTLFRLRAGDLVFTGTPAGVGAVNRGDRIECGIDGVGNLDFRIR